MPSPSCAEPAGARSRGRSGPASGPRRFPASPRCESYGHRALHSSAIRAFVARPARARFAAGRVRTTARAGASIRHVAAGSSWRLPGAGYRNSPPYFVRCCIVGFGEDGGEGTGDGLGLAPELSTSVAVLDALAARATMSALSAFVDRVAERLALVGVLNVGFELLEPFGGSATHSSVPVWVVRPTRTRRPGPDRWRRRPRRPRCGSAARLSSSCSGPILAVSSWPVNYTDTHGYTEINFAAFVMVGMQFCPRIRSLHRQRIYCADPARDHGVLKPVLQHGRRR